jgi:hypothetical protein
MSSENATHTKPARQQQPPRLNDKPKERREKSLRVTATQPWV